MSTDVNLKAIGRGPYRVEQSMGSINVAFEAPTKEEALEMASMASDPAEFVWDIRKAVIGDDLDRLLFAGWEPFGSASLPTRLEGYAQLVVLVRRKLHRPSGPIGVTDSEEADHA